MVSTLDLTFIYTLSASCIVGTHLHHSSVMALGASAAVPLEEGDS